MLVLVLVVECMILWQSFRSLCFAAMRYSAVFAVGLVFVQHFLCVSSPALVAECFFFLAAMAVLCKGLEVCVTPRLSLFAAISARSDVV